MKRKYTFFATFLAATVQAFAQFPAAIGTKWEYAQYYGASYPEPPDLESFSDEIEKDTVIGTTTYLKVVRTGVIYGWTDVDFVSTDVSGIYFIRSDGDRVYAIDSIKDNSVYESVLYDFSVEAGQTLPYVPSNIMELASKEDSYYRKTHYGAQEMDVYDNSTLYQGDVLLHFNLVWKKDIGITYLMPYLVFPGPVSGGEIWLRKLTSDGATLFDFIIAGNHPSKENYMIELYPNPTSDKLTIHVKEAGKISFISSNGATVKIIDVSSGYTDLDISSLEKGMYTVMLKANNILNVQRLVKY